MGDPWDRVTRYVIEMAIVIAILLVVTVVGARRGRKVLPTLGLMAIAAIAGVATLVLIGSNWGHMPPLGPENFSYCSSGTGSGPEPGCMRQGPLLDGWLVPALPAAAVVFAAVLVAEAVGAAMVLRRDATAAGRA